ncbi:MAG: DUF2973 domain-containing protein [Spirulinaceae cyanobacterium SM2_1_0]|nr:DUF2973 domain-containing protein [Spirulinaceae cyanobacterium SM2_1_0]
MLHLLYILAFTAIAVLALSNLLRNLVMLMSESNRRYTRSGSSTTRQSQAQRNLHPELLDDRGRPIEEPLLVMRSVDVDEAREHLDALYNASPSGSAPETSDDS